MMRDNLLKLFIPTLMVTSVYSLRIPQNPCPDVFSYYKNTDGYIYGEANVPYDGSNKLEFSVNASLVGRFDKADLKIQLVTPLRRIPNSPKLKYNIFFPFTDIIPKITQITYNGQIYCSGPPEPLTPGTSGITNVWFSHIYGFYNMVSKGNEYPDDNDISVDGNDTSDDDIPVKDPNSARRVSTSSTTRPTINDNAFLDPIFDSGVVATSDLSDQQCGVSKRLAVPRILGGTETESGQYPWLCAMFTYNTISSNYYEYKCTATLISDKHVITAGRCVQYYNVQVVPTDDILIVMGTEDLLHWATNGAITRGARNVQVFADFKKNSNSAHGDMAIITLDKPVQFSNKLKPICLWKDPDTDLYPLVNKIGTVAGWGQDEDSQKTGKLSILKAKHVKIPVVSQFDCLKSDISFRTITSQKTFCAGDKNKKGPCIGDSGSGFAVQKGGVFYLRGIASLTASINGSCDLQDKYAVFCDVAKFMDWVNTCMTS